MIRLALLVILAADPPDAGVQVDAPWIEVRDGGSRVVCMTEATSVVIAGNALGTEVEQKDDKAALLKTDPEPLKVVLFTAGGFVVGAGITAAVICALVPGHCGLSKTP